MTVGRCSVGIKVGKGVDGRTCVQLPKNKTAVTPTSSKTMKRFDITMCSRSVCPESRAPGIEIPGVKIEYGSRFLAVFQDSQ